MRRSSCGVGHRLERIGCSQTETMSSGDNSMSRKYRRGNGNDLRFIHNVRPAMELSAPPKWTALMLTAGVAIALAALLTFVIGG